MYRHPSIREPRHPSAITVMRCELVPELFVSGFIWVYSFLNRLIDKLQCLVQVSVFCAIVGVFGTVLH